jgi:hypothetical protein
MGERDKQLSPPGIINSPTASPAQNFINRRSNRQEKQWNSLDLLQ